MERPPLAPLESYYVYALTAITIIFTSVVLLYWLSPVAVVLAELIAIGPCALFGAIVMVERGRPRWSTDWDSFAKQCWEQRSLSSPSARHASEK